MTLEELRWRVRELAGISASDMDTSPQDLDSHINGAYHLALGLHDWPFLRGTATVSTSLGQDRYPLPASARQVRGAVNVDASNSGQRRLRPRDATSFDDRAFDVESGEPREYAVDSGDIVVNPVPDGVYLLEVQTILATPRLEADDDVPVLPETFHDMLAMSAAARVLRRRRSTGDVGRSDDLDAEAAAHVERLIFEELADHDRTPMVAGGREARGRHPRIGRDRRRSWR